VSEAKTKGTRAGDIPPLPPEFEDFGTFVKDHIEEREAQEVTRTKLQGDQPTDIRSTLLAMNPKFLVGIIFLMATALVSTSGLVVKMVGSHDAAQDQAIAELRSDLNPALADIRSIKRELPGIRDDNQEIKKIQWQLLSESLIQGRAFAEDRGLKDEAAAYTKKLKALNARIAATERIEAAERAANEGGTK
jgi:hypothetical protein